MALPVSPPVAPMLAKLARELPDGGWVYEPKWDGFRALAFRDGEDVDLRSRHDRRFARYFPEVVAALRAVPPTRFVLDGELLVVRDGALDFAALLARLHPARSRADLLARDTPAVLVAFDLLAVGDADLRAEPFRVRRARLEELVGRAASPRVLVTPATPDRARAADWLARFRGGGIDGVVAKDPGRPYEPGRRTMIKVKRERTLDCVVGGLRLFAGEPPAVASLLLGVWDGDRLLHVGVASQFREAERRALATALGPLVVPLAGHPWERGFGLDPSPIGRLHGAAGRWSPDEMVRDWISVRPALVCEVAYGTIDGRRMRHPARFLRWRPDREPRSCGVDQLDPDVPDVRPLLSPHARR
jgi:ATP-dependent DNA ligase